MKKIKSYGFWVALSGAVVLLVNSLGEIFGFAVEDQVISNLIMAVAGVLIVLGVVNMPSKEELEEIEDQKTEEQSEKLEQEDCFEEKDNTDI